MNDQPLTTTSPMQLSTWEDMERMAKNVADSKMFGITSASQAMCLFAICQAEGLNPITALRRYHLIEGRPSMRADAMMAEFLKAGGGVTWHVRSDDLAAATWYADIRKIDDAARERAVKRFDLLWTLSVESDPDKKSKLFQQLSALARDGEETIYRTYFDCETKGITIDSKGGTKTNWARHPREMLTARNATEGIRIVMPGLVTGIVEENEARDIAEDARGHASAPQSHELEAMRLILAQHEQNALAAKTDYDLKRYQVLAADMRLLIQEAEEKLKPATSSAPATHQSRSVLKAPDSTPLDDVPMHHPADPKVVEAKIDKVEPPDKGGQMTSPAKPETAKSSEKPVKPEEPGPFDDQKPAGRSNEPIVSDLSMWEEYVLCKVPPGPFKGKKLGDCSRIEIGVLYKKRCIPLLNHPEADMKLEALMIQQAHDGGTK